MKFEIGSGKVRSHLTSTVNVNEQKENELRRLIAIAFDSNRVLKGDSYL